MTSTCKDWASEGRTESDSDTNNRLVVYYIGLNDDVPGSILYKLKSVGRVHSF